MAIWREKEVPPGGFEPPISALRGRRPQPLDDGGELVRVNRVAGVYYKREGSLSEGKGLVSSIETILS